MLKYAICQEIVRKVVLNASLRLVFPALEGRWCHSISIAGFEECRKLFRTLMQFVGLSILYTFKAIFQGVKQI